MTTKLTPTLRCDHGTMRCRFLFLFLFGSIVLFGSPAHAVSTKVGIKAYWNGTYWGAAGDTVYAGSDPLAMSEVIRTKGWVNDLVVSPRGIVVALAKDGESFFLSHDLANHMSAETTPGLKRLWSVRDIYLARSASGQWLRSNNGWDWEPIKLGDDQCVRYGAAYAAESGLYCVTGVRANEFGHEREPFAWISKDGWTWTEHPIVSPNTDIWIQEVFAPVSDGKWFYSLSQGGLIRSNNGKIWEKIHSPLIKDTYSAILVHASPEGLFLAVEEKLYRSTDKGASWSETTAATDGAKITDCRYFTDAGKSKPVVGPRNGLVRVHEETASTEKVAATPPTQEKAPESPMVKNSPGARSVFQPGTENFFPAILDGTHSSIPHGLLYAIVGVRGIDDVLVIDGRLHIIVKALDPLSDDYDSLILTAKDYKDTVPNWTVTQTLPYPSHMIRYAKGVWLGTYYEPESKYTWIMIKAGDKEWEMYKHPQFFQQPNDTKIHATGKGFVAEHAGALHFSADGRNWRQTTTLGTLSDYVSPASFHTVQSEQGWLFVLPEAKDLSYSEQKEGIPLLVSQDGEQWSEFGKIHFNRSEFNIGFISLTDSPNGLVGVLHQTGSPTRGFTLDAGKGLDWQAHYFNDERMRYFDLVFARGKPWSRTLGGMFSQDEFGLMRMETGDNPSLPKGRAYPWLGYNDRKELPIKFAKTTRVGNDLFFVEKGFTSVKADKQYFVLSDFFEESEKGDDLVARFAGSLKTLPSEPEIRFQSNSNTGEFLVLKSKADQGVAAAAFDVAMALDNGIYPVLENDFQSRKYMLIAGKGNYAPAFREVAKKLGIHANHQTEAVGLYEQAAELGDTESMRELAQAHWVGSMGLSDKQKAKELAKRAADAGDEAAVMLSQFISNVEAADSGDASAAKLVLEAIESKKLADNLYGDRRDKYAELAIGSESEATLLVKLVEESKASNQTMAHLILLRLVELGSAQGLTYAGVCSVEGKMGFEIDVSKAIGYFEQAAGKDSTESMQHLARVYGEGFGGISVNDMKAREWVEKARATGASDFADKYIKVLDERHARNKSRGAKDGHVEGLNPMVFKVITDAKQRSVTSWIRLDDIDIQAMFVAIWYDGTFDFEEEDLIQELFVTAETMLVLEGTDSTGLKTKIRPSGTGGLKEQWKQVFPLPFPVSNQQYPIVAWSLARTVGPVVFFLKSEATKEAVAAQFEQAFSAEFRKRVNAEGQGKPSGLVEAFVDEILFRCRNTEPEVGRFFARFAYDIYAKALNAEELARVSGLADYGNGGK